MDPLTRTGLPRTVHPDLSPVPVEGDGVPAVDGALPGNGTEEAGGVVGAGPFKVYSPGLADWEPGIDLRADHDGLALTTPAGHHAYATSRFAVEVSPDGRIIWILGDISDASGGPRTADADGHPPVTVLMPADLAELSSRMPGVRFEDLEEAAHTIRRLTAAAAAGRNALHRFGLQRPGDLALVVDPVEGEPVLSLLRITDHGLEFRSEGRWESRDPADGIPLFAAIVPAAQGAIARFDRLEQSPSMSLSLFDRFALLPDRFRTAAFQQHTSTVLAPPRARRGEKRRSRLVPSAPH